MFKRVGVGPVAESLAVLLGILAILAGPGCSSRESAGKHQAEGAGGAAGGGLSWSEIPPGKPPSNLILITMDTTRRDRLSCYGYSQKTTPNLDRIAARGLLFEQAFTPVPVTLPSHATMMTGLYPFQHGVRNNGSYVLADSLTTLAEMLKAKGYDTGAVLGGFPVDHRFGLAQGFGHYDDEFPPSSAAREGDAAQRPAKEVTRLSLEWIGQHAERPFFLWVHYFDPHAPYHPPEPYLGRFPGEPYNGEVSSMDAAIGQLVDGLKSRGLEKRTILLVVADHGEGLMDHGEATHAMFIYGSTQDVPLLMQFPDREPWTGKTWRHRRVQGLAGLTDLLPTAWNALGFAKTELPRVAGRSLLPLIEGTGSGHEWLYHETLVPDLDFGMSELRGLQTTTWKYIRAPQPELYNLEEDPGELSNQVDRERDRVQAMESKLAEILQAEKRGSGPVAMDQETLEKLRSLGYLQGGSPRAEVKRADPKEQPGVVRVTARAQAMAEANRLPEALAVLDSLLQVSPQTRLALRLRALYLTRLERGPEALEAYTRALADCHGCPDEFRLLQEQANAYLVAGQVDEALRRTRILTKARPREQGLNLLLGEILLKKGDLAGAREAYAREAELFPLDALPLVRLGSLAVTQSHPGEAEQFYRKALAVNPESVDALVMLSDLLDETGRRAEAEQLIDRALAVNPTSTEAQHRKAWLLRESGRKEAAIQLLQTGLRAQPGNGSLLFDLGCLYSEVGREKEAKECYEKAVKTGQAPAGAYSNLGVLAAQAGRFDEAIKLWQQALDRKPTAQEADITRANIRKAQEMIRNRGATGR
jgi:choline-sulfatase